MMSHHFLESLFRAEPICDWLISVTLSASPFQINSEKNFSYRNMSDDYFFSDIRKRDICFIDLLRNFANFEFLEK